MDLVEDGQKCSTAVFDAFMPFGHNGWIGGRNRECFVRGGRQCSKAVFNAVVPYGHNGWMDALCHMDIL